MGLLDTTNVIRTIVLMRIVADTSAFLAVVLDEPERDRIIGSTAGDDLIAPAVLPYEIGNALTAMLKRGKLLPTEVSRAWNAAEAIAVDLRNINIGGALRIATRFGIYAYDAYFLECAATLRLPLLTLDRGMKHVAREMDVALVGEP